MSEEYSSDQVGMDYRNILDKEEIEKLKQENIRLQSQMHEANDIITHVVFNSKDSQNIAYNYLAKYGLIKAERNNQI